MKSSTQILADSFGRFHNYLRMSLTERCNLRCVYCMPKDGVMLTPPQKLATLEERKRIISLFAKHGVTKLRFTGGEPTVSKDLIELIAYSKSLGSIQSIGITTNGLVVSSMLDALTSAGLTHVNISLDTLEPDKFENISRRDRKGLAKILSSVYKSISKGLHVKVNCVLMRGVNEMEMGNMIELFKEDPVDIRFIEMMPFDDNEWNSDKMIPYFEAIEILKSQNVYLHKMTSRDRNDTTKWYDSYSEDGVKIGMGRVGFITSMTSHFCGGCNRVRVTADGKLKVCLFGDESLSIIQAFRDGYNDDEVSKLIHESIMGKKKSLGGHETSAELVSSRNRPMILIGG